MPLPPERAAAKKKYELGFALLVILVLATIAYGHFVSAGRKVKRSPFGRKVVAWCDALSYFPLFHS